MVKLFYHNPQINEFHKTLASSIHVNHLIIFVCVEVLYHLFAKQAKVAMSVEQPKRILGRTIKVNAGN